MINSAISKTRVQELLDIQFGISKAISEGSDPLAILDHMLEALKTIEGVDAVGVYFRSGSGNKFVLRGNRGLDPDTALEVSVIEAGVLDHLDDKLHGYGFSQVISFPITVQGEAKGYLVAASTDASGISLSIETSLKTVAANLSGMIIRSKTEAALRSSRYNLSTVFEKFEDFLFVVGNSGRIIACNKCNLNILGYTQEEIKTKSISRILPEFKSLFNKQNYEFSNKSCEGICQVHQGNLLDHNNRMIPVEVRISHGRWDDDDVWYVTCRDVRERIAMERERNRLSKAIEQTTESVVITNAAGTIIYTNPAFCKLSGYSKDEVLGANPRILKSGHHDPAFYSQLWATISRGDTWSGRFVNNRKDGTRFIEEASISPMRDENGLITHFIGVKRDVSSEVGLEIKLRDSQKMEAIGTLAGGIAHDFNNILYALLGYGQLALDDIPEDHPAYIPVQEICKAGERATDLVDKMLTFGRRVDAGRESLDLKPVVEEALGLARASLPATIEFRLNLQDDCPPVLANQTQIHQVVLNMCTNAEYALRSSGGSLDVTLAPCETGLDARPKYANLPPGKWVCLEFSDTGVGMEQVVIDRIFEPYFTTKKPHEGTGLGLATTHGIIKSHKGHIYVDSTPGEGTTFTIFFPVSQSDTASEEGTSRSGQKSAPEKTPGQGNIMIIDDEQMIVEILCKALPRLGYEVAGFTDGIKALEVFRVSPGAFDLVITDQTMPNITGFEVASELLSIRPDLPIILTTGYADQAGENQSNAIGISKFVSKPLKISELSEMVDELLGETAQI